MSKEKMRISKLKAHQGDVKTPVPADKHTYCGICYMNYSNYKEHIQSMTHKASVEMDKDDLFSQIDEVIDQFDLMYKAKQVMPKV